MIIDLILNYLGITTLIAFSYIFIFDKSYQNILIISSIMDLFYYNYFIIYLTICYIIIKIIYKYIKQNTITNIIILYFITIIYYLLTIKIYNIKLIIIYSTLPCIFYLLINIIKYEKTKQNINCCNHNIIYLNRYKKKQNL